MLSFVALFSEEKDLVPFKPNKIFSSPHQLCCTSMSSSTAPSTIASSTGWTIQLSTLETTVTNRLTGASVNNPSGFEPQVAVLEAIMIQISSTILPLIEVRRSSSRGKIEHHKNIENSRRERVSGGMTLGHIQKSRQGGLQTSGAEYSANEWQWMLDCLEVGYKRCAEELFQGSPKYNYALDIVWDAQDHADYKMNLKIEWKGRIHERAMTVELRVSPDGVPTGESYGGAQTSLVEGMVKDIGITGSYTAGKDDTGEELAASRKTSQETLPRYSGQPEGQ